MTDTLHWPNVSDLDDRQGERIYFLTKTKPYALEIPYGVTPSQILDRIIRAFIMEVPGAYGISFIEHTHIVNFADAPHLIPHRGSRMFGAAQDLNW